MKFFTAGTEALELDASQNATFAGDVSLANLKSIYLGTSSALRIYTDSATAYLRGDDVRLTNAANDSIVRVNGDVAELYYNDLKKFETTSTGVTVTGKVSGVTAGTANTDAVNLQQLNNATTGVLVYQGVWNASTNTPTLASATGTPGYYYIVDTDGSTNLDGITDWKVGDWAVFSDMATDAWQKIDNTSILGGAGTGGTVALWSGSGTSLTLSDAPITASGGNTTITGKLGVGSVNAGFDFYNNGTSYFNGAVTIDSDITQTGATIASFTNKVGVGTVNPYAFDTTETKFHVQNAGTAGSVVEVARFEGSSDADGSGATVRISTSNDRGMYFQAGRTGTVPYGEIGTTEYNGVKTLAITLDNSGNTTFAGDVAISSTMPKLTFTDLQQDDWRIMNDNGDFRFTNIDGSGHALILATNNNATFAGTVTAAVIGVDSLTFNGTEIDSSGSLEIDAAADITIDAGGGDIILSDDGTIFGTFSKSGNDLQLRSRISDGDLLLRGVDGGVTIDALKLDMSAGGAATFAGKLGIGITPVELLDIQSASGDARIRLDAPSGSDTEVKFFNAGVAQYTIGHDDATDNFVIGGANVDAPLVSVGKTGNATFAGDVTISKAATPLFKLLDTTNNISLLLGADDANTFIRSSSTANVYIQPGGSTAMTFKASGQVGIGTTAPDFELDVAGNIGMDNKLYHNGDHNTYIGFEHDNIKLRTGGVDAITVNSSQNVGIGTTGPAYKLDVDGDVQINETLIAKAGADLILQARSSQVVGINSNGARTMTLNASNNVGIGTTAPGAKLDVSSDIRTATRYLIATGTANETAAIGYWDGVNFRVESGSAKPMLITSYQGNIKLGINGGTTMTVQSSNVGIGTTAPARKLTIGNGNGFINNQISLLDGGGTEQATIAVETTVANDLLVASKANLRFFTGSTIGSTATLPTNERIRITSAGNVGIGTSSPDSKLSVTSTTLNSEDILYLKSGADNVNDYLGIAWELGVGGNGPHSAIRSFAGPSGSDARLGFLTTSDGGTTLTEGLSVAHNGNVGIGTSSPAQKFVVANATNGQGIEIVPGTTGTLQSYDRNASAYVGLNIDTLSTQIRSINTTIFKNGSGFAESMRITSAGNVGIGTTSPDTKLEVRTDSGAAFSNSYFRVTAGASGAYGGTAHFEGAYNDYGNVNQPNIVGKIDMGSEVVTSTDVGGTMKFFTKATGGTYATAPIERMRIGHGGNVGIGPNALSTAGGDRLHVDGTLRVGPFFSTNDRDHIKLYPHGTDSKIISPNERFHIENLSGDIILNAGGNVGIGTTSPGIKLDVNSGGSDSVARFTSTDARARILISDNNDISYFGTYIGTTFLGPDDTPSGNTINVLSNGNVGIGTTSIDEKLQVEAGNIKIEGGATSTVRGLIIAHTGWTGNQTLLVQDTTTNRGHLYTTERALRIEAGSGGGTGTGETLDFWVNGSERMMIDTTGNVGINTTAPLAKLDVRGTLRSDQGSSGPNGTSGVGELDTLIGDAGPDNTALGTPDQWLRINISGTDYVIPAYTAP